MIPEQEWLAKARQLAVGMKIRTRHLHENRENLIIANAQDRWWCYCQRCHAGGVVMKDHVVLTASAEQMEVELTLPPDIRPLRGSEFEIAVARFLSTKNMAIPYLPELHISEKRKRVLVRAEGKWHGRDLTGRSPMKWMNYEVSRVVGHPGALGTVLVEDLFSKYKVEFALRKFSGYGVVCALGTGCSSPLVTRVLHSPYLIWMYDADRAGDEGFEHGRRRLRPFVQHQVRARPPEGLDPKDMDCAAIRRLILGDNYG